ncbi:MAG: hypothetical protein HQL87_10780 [Magnetococcales bacterium]|nr:hypothetical protein [Magnetococcales bacterium]
MSSTTTRRRSFALTHPFTERNFALSDQQGDGHHPDQGGLLLGIGTTATPTRPMPPGGER